MPDGFLKYLSRRTTSDKESRGKSFNVAKNPRYDLYQCGLALVLYFFFFFFFDKKSAGTATHPGTGSNSKI